MTGYGIGMMKNSKFKEMVNRKLLEYSYSGELERSTNFWFSGVCKNHNQQNKRSSHRLDILNFFSTFFLLGAGMVIALIVFTVDHLYSYFIKSKITKLWYYESIKSTNKATAEAICDIWVRKCISSHVVI